jgi:RNA polymerase sigma-70 factor (ECF subfamily)
MDDVSHEPSDERLISDILEGDEGAFAHLVSRYKRRVFSLAGRFARDDDELEDICQEVFIKAYENLKSFRHDAPFEHWITRIAVRCCYDVLRARRREKGFFQLDEQVFQIMDKAEQARSEARQARDLLRWAMGHLKADERLVITMLELEEQSVREISELTGWSESNVKVRAHRARQALKRILEANNET